MFHSIDNLVRNQWIVEIVDDIGKFTFVHPLFYQTLYDVTPASDKARLHYAIACYIEDKFDKQPTYFAQLGHQYGLAKDCRPKALEYFVRAAVYCMNSGPFFYDEGLELLIQAKIFTETAIDCGIILSIILFNRNKLTCLRMKLIEDEERDCDGAAIDSAVPHRSKSFFNWNFPNFQKITPITSPSRATSLHMNSKDSTKSRPGTYKTDGQGLTVNGADIFLNLFRQVEDEINSLYVEMLKNNLQGTPTEWQKTISDEMRGEARKQDELSVRDKREYSKRHRGNVLILAAGSIKMISNAVGGNGRKTSLLDLLNKSNSSAPSINQNALSNLHGSGNGTGSPIEMLEKEMDRERKETHRNRVKEKEEIEKVKENEREKEREKEKEKGITEINNEKEKTDQIFSEENEIENKIIRTTMKSYLNKKTSSKTSHKSCQEEIIRSSDPARKDDLSSLQENKKYMRCSIS